MSCIFLSYCGKGFSWKFDDFSNVLEWCKLNCQAPLKSIKANNAQGDFILYSTLAIPISVLLVLFLLSFYFHLLRPFIRDNTEAQTDTFSFVPDFL